MKAVCGYMKAQSFPLSQAVVRLDGQYGNRAIVADLAGLSYVMRGKDYNLLDLAEVQARLAQPPDQQTIHPETGTCRVLFDFSDLSLFRELDHEHESSSPHVRGARNIGEGRHYPWWERLRAVYTALPPGAFTPADVVALYLHRGAFETVLADENEEQEPDRWCSHTAWGQEFWLILAEWVWNIQARTGACAAPRSYAHDGICSCPGKGVCGDCA